MKTGTQITLSSDEVVKAVKAYVALHLLSVEIEDIDRVDFFDDKAQGQVYAFAVLKEVEIQ